VSIRRCSDILEVDGKRVNPQFISNFLKIVQRAAEQSKTGIYHGYGLAEVPLFFKAGSSD
jgi:hypothetical protein